MKIGYFVNQYPKISHSFIRREILALEQQGVRVSRYALESDLSELVDPSDISEFHKTEFLLNKGIITLIKSAFKALISKPIKWLCTLSLMHNIGWGSDRGLLRHYIYFLEACYLSQLLEKEDVTHLHAHFGTNPAAVALMASKLTGIPYSFTVHGPEEFDKPKFISLATKIEQSAFTVAISSFGKSQMFRLIDNKYWPKINEVHCGLDEKFIDAEIIPIKGNNKYVSIGRLCEQKGQQILVQAVHELKKQSVEIKLDLIGDGPMRSDIEALIAKYNLDENISIKGWYSAEQIKEALIESRSMILPSFAEGLPVVIMEAMALGRPVISTMINGIPELVKSGTNGLLCPAADLTSLVEAIKTMNNYSDKEINSMGNKAKQSVCERHDINIEAKKLAELFKSHEGIS